MHGMQAYLTLAERLPYAKHVHSKILCGVTKTLMDEDNVPMVMPNGTVYSEAAVRRLSSDTGTFTCPNTGTDRCIGTCECPLMQLVVTSPDPGVHSVSCKDVQYQHMVLKCCKGITGAPYPVVVVLLIHADIVCRCSV